VKNYYQILEVSPDAPGEMIKEKYRLLILAWHPDRFPTPAQKVEAEKKAKEINEAYNVLSDSAKRAQYDREHHFQSTEFDAERE
jgi:curved DNA-binding protein CbpA